MQLVSTGLPRATRLFFNLSLCLRDGLLVFCFCHKTYFKWGSLEFCFLSFGCHIYPIAVLILWERFLCLQYCTFQLVAKFILSLIESRLGWVYQLTRMIEELLPRSRVRVIERSETFLGRGDKDLASADFITMLTPEGSSLFLKKVYPFFISAAMIQ